MAKRGENIRKRKDGRWEARILTDTGKTKSIYAQSYSQLKEKIRKPQTEPENQRENILFKELSNKWLKESEIKNKQSTCAIYRGIIQRHILPYFGHMKANTIERNHINSFIAQKAFQGKLEVKTIHDITRVLMQIIKYGENLGYIHNFIYDITTPKLNRKELTVLTPTEQEKLVNLIKQDINCENIGILLSLYAGLRLGEICALQWGDIDLNLGIISVTKTMQRISATDKTVDTKTVIIIDTPKSQKSIRKIPIPYFLLTELKKLSKGCTDESYVLTSSKSRYTEPRTYQYKFKKYLKQSGIQDTNFHALRHTFATRAVEQNVDIKTLSEILGHSTVNFTLDRYVHPSFELKKQNMEKLVVCY